MEELMKKICPLLISIILLSLISCTEKQNNRININPDKEKASYGTEITVTPTDFVTFKNDTIIIAPEKEDVNDA